MQMFPWFNDLFEKLLRVDLEAQLPGIPLKSEDPSRLTHTEIRKLLGAASALSLSDNQRSRILAYEVASRLVELYGNELKGTVLGADIVLSRIGNFPGRVLLRNNYGKIPGASPRAPTHLAIERLARELENTITAAGNRNTPLTDFQFDLFHALGEHKSFSVSAPTSAGKSFVLSLDLVRRLGRSQQSVVYLVPTRALIREVSGSIRVSLRAAGMEGVPVRSAPFGLSKEEVPQGAVYVLTQERLMTLLSSDSQAWISTLIVDEAHNVQDDSRGVILQTVIERVAKRFPNAEIHFASPLSKNPELLLHIIGRPSDQSTMVEAQSPVSQNVILVSQVDRRPSTAKFSLMSNEVEIALGVRELPFSFRGSPVAQRAQFARAITAPDEATILFANDPHTAEQLALQLCDISSELPSTSQHVEELIDYLRKEIHPAYSLIRCLGHGVAYHYGHMPSLVRGRVEDLFKSGEVKFICCTSTLLQGVNLPARHIIIENPKRGKASPMPRRDFLNLAGRAGRLLREFHGNVWCIRPETWEEPVFRGDALVEISSAVDNAMRDGGSIVKNAIEGKGTEKAQEYGEAILGKLYLDSLSPGGTTGMTRWENPDNAETLMETESIIRTMKVSLPLHVLEANAGLRPDKLQVLFDFMNEMEDAEQLMPLNPWAPGYYDRMKATIQLLEIVFRNKDDRSYEYFAWLASRWIHDAPLSDIIRDSINADEDEDRISSKIRSLLKTLETEIRYRLVKYYAAYTSILKYLLENRGETVKAQRIEPYQVYLECGASHATTLNLIALGISRSTALSASRALRFPTSYTPEQCLTGIAIANLDRLDIPDLCKRELKELVGEI
jgi:superfamily II DNA/RNA helicase